MYQHPFANKLNNIAYLQRDTYTLYIYFVYSVTGEPTGISEIHNALLKIWYVPTTIIK